ncbi:DUF202 domain-containing protein [Pseudomonas sp. BGr12]|uniref:DUF202 domain-containing protein n=1 Tax=unclassified Pseudomonas TaxID=196821 RepID=UPI001784A9EC|nr:MULTISPECIES: DUF202 domain-containing protein [unclassified Pseudomonas]MBD9504831.1 DUF202 domain-containing protein [Pseudomonas sp. PDM17]MBD9579279.1 DUF202 domain-containing protein [Pseudomonas sp. PDM23]MBD9672736.1 DUF202 domain-containing protein [Pseudomonas sp. PDM21]MDL2428101.1 DUF202 domain-containing protein [Pseudomonas sp. BJa5]
MNRDKGLQAERTTLAWTRTLLVLLVLAALVLRRIGELSALALVPAALLVSCALVCLVGQGGHYRRSRRALAGDHSGGNGRAVACLSLALVLTAGILLGLILLHDEI